mgnify:CR=1 FL=1
MTKPENSFDLLAKKVGTLSVVRRPTMSKHRRTKDAIYGVREPINTTRRRKHVATKSKDK